MNIFLSILGAALFWLVALNLLAERGHQARFAPVEYVR